MLGDVQFYKARDYIVASIFGQYQCGAIGERLTDYDAIIKALSTIANTYPEAIVRIPYKMGCGSGGGDWNEIYEIIKETLVGKGIDVEIWQY